MAECPYLELVYTLADAHADCAAVSFHGTRGKGVFAAQEAGSRRLHWTQNGLTKLIHVLNSRRSPALQLRKAHAYAACHGQRKYHLGVTFRRFITKASWDAFVVVHGKKFDLRSH